MANRSFLLLVNPAAGKRNYKDKADKIISFLEDHSFDFLTYYTQPKENIPTLNQFLKNNSQLTDIIILGGDGTINICINALPHFDYIISIVTNGTGNDSVKNLYPYRNFERQLANIVMGKIKIIDLGKCNDRFFINGVGIGFDGLVVEKLNNQKKRRKGLMAYLTIVLQLLPRPVSWEIDLEIDHRKLTKKIFSITATKGSTFGGGFVMNPKAINNDGLIDICIFNKLSLFEKTIILPWVFFGKHGWAGKVEFLKCKRVNIKSNSAIKAHIDGELIESNQFNVEVVPQKLHIRF